MRESKANERDKQKEKKCHLLFVDGELDTLTVDVKCKSPDPDTNGTDTSVARVLFHIASV